MTGLQNKIAEGHEGNTVVGRRSRVHSSPASWQIPPSAWSAVPVGMTQHY